MRILKNKLLLSGIIILLIIAIPSFIFSVYQYSTITNEEQVVDDIYKNQLETILFSINQYSIDVVNSWVNKLNELYLSGKEISESELSDFINSNEQILQIDIKEYSNIKTAKTVVSKLKNQQNISVIINNYLENHNEDIERLGVYLKSNYQQVLGIQQVYESDYTFLIFVLKTNKSPLLGIFSINTDKFIKEVLSPKIQEVAEEQMNIVVYHNDLDKVIFSNQPKQESRNIQKSKELWLFSGYFIGIELKGSTLNDLVKKRVKTVIFLVILFNVVIIFGIIFLYRNIRREVEFAKIKSDFVSNVSHELRTPLAMISMYIETLLLGRLKNEEKRNEYYKIIHQETTHLSGIVDNILNFSRIENNKRAYHFSDSMINDIVDEIVAIYKYELTNKGFTYIFLPDKNLKPISIDPEAVKDAISNLLSNSIKYSDKQKYIEISTGESSNYQFIKLVDKGIGISEKEQKYIFDKFYRVTEGNLATKAKGSGLGLSIVKHIMDAHKGKIEVESNLNQGSQFKLIFPKISKN